MMSRQYYLDNLKVCLTVLVVFHHAGQAYGNGGDWAYTPSNPAEFLPWIWHFFSVNASFFMGLFFLISGYFVPVSYDRQGGMTFVRKKLMRLGIPLLAMGGIISMLSGKLEAAHMWFVESLLLFSLVYALARSFCKPVANDCDSKPTFTMLVIVAVVMGIGGHLIRQVSPQDHWIWPFGIIPLPMEPAHYLQYVMMFVSGILLRRFRWLDKLNNRLGGISLAIGILLALGIYMCDDSWWSSLLWQWFGIYESLLCVFLCFGLLWLFQYKFNNSSRIMKWCAEQSYGVYVVHLPLILILQFAFDKVWMGGFGKFLFIGISSTIVSFLLTWLLRLIPGVKKIL